MYKKLFFTAVIITIFSTSLFSFKADTGKSIFLDHGYIKNNSVSSILNLISDIKQLDEFLYSSYANSCYKLNKLQ